jgi:hypothetical protein
VYSSAWKILYTNMRSMGGRTRRGQGESATRVQHERGQEEGGQVGAQGECGQIHKRTVRG